MGDASAAARRARRPARPGLPLARCERGAAADPASPRLVVVGAPGLSWSDLDGGDLPGARRHGRAKARVGSMTVRAVRSRSCAVDGWLTLSAGRRAGRRRRAVPRAAAGRRRPCAALGRVPRGRGRRARTTPTRARSGRGSRHPAPASRRSGRARRSVAPTAPVAGDEPRASRCRRRSAARWCSSTVGVLPESGAERHGGPARLDALVAQVRAADPAPTSSWPGSVTASRRCGRGRWWRPGRRTARGLLTSASTRQPGVVQLQDLTATALTRVGASDAEVTGRPLTVSASTGSAARWSPGGSGSRPAPRRCGP